MINILDDLITVVIGVGIIVCLAGSVWGIAYALWYTYWRAE